MDRVWGTAAMNRFQSIAKAAALSEGLPLASGEPAFFLFPLEGPHYLAYLSMMTAVPHLTRQIEG